MLDRNIHARLLRFLGWLDRHGETSWDHQSFFASDFTGSLKALYYRSPLLGKLAVSPIIFLEAVAPGARTWFWKPQRFAIADAHYAMGFALLSQVFEDNHYYRRAVHFLEVLKATRCPGYSEYCWGYPFDWETRNGVITANTPLITTIPYVYEAFRGVHQIDNDPRWLEVMRSIAEHAAQDYRDFDVSDNASTCSYTPSEHDAGGVINASAYRAFLLTRAAVDFSEDHYRKIAERNLNFVIDSQNADGSWYYAMDGVRDFVDHFHTCFVLKALAKIEQITQDSRCSKAIERGVEYYVENLFDQDGRPRPFSRKPRLTIYRQELYDYAECINLAALLRGRFPRLDGLLPAVLNLDAWQKPDGSFRARRLVFGWDNTPMHRWAQAQMFRSLSFLLYRESRGSEPMAGAVQFANRGNTL